MKLFKKLAAIYSGSGREQKIREYIKRWIYSSVKDVTINIDRYGNMYVVKGYSDTYPCVVAHLDQVQQQYPRDYRVIETNDIIFGYSPSKREYCGLGADDKCGIWIALKMLKKHDNIKVAFFPGEEIGCVGSSRADMTFFDNVRFVVEPDRRGASDLITKISYSDICSKSFVDAIGYADFGYKPTSGLMTDVLSLKENGLNVSCINLSCGYYYPHTEQEYVVKSDMINALNFVDNIIENCTEVYSHKYEWDNFGYFPKNKTSKTSYLYPYDASSKSKSALNTPNELEADASDEFNEYCNQYAEAEDWIAANILDIPEMTAREFLASYGTDLYLLDEADIQEILDLYQYSPYECGYGDDYDSWDDYFDKRRKNNENEEAVK